MKVSDIQVTLIDSMGSDLSVVNAARVSFHKESGWEWDEEFLEYKQGVLKPSDAKLINYLAKHKHFSPFNHTYISMRIKAPIFVARQLVKHKFMPWNEVSRRYVDEEPEFYWPEVWRAKADNVKQGSAEKPAEYMKELQWDGTEGYPCDFPVENLVLNDLNQTIMWYKDMVDNGVCAEQARMILPQNMMTEWIWSGTLGAWCDMLRLRLDPHTQYESRIVATKAREIIEPIFPVSVKALLDA